MPLYEYFNTTNQTSPHFERHENFVTDIALPACALVQTFPYSQRCAYASKSGTCGENVFLVDYIHLLYCRMSVSNGFTLCIGVLLLMAICIYLFLILGITADSFFCPSLKVLSNMLHLNENVAGVTLLAFGNSASDIFTCFAGLQRETRNVYTDVYGSVTFVVFLVAGLIVSLMPFEVQPTSFMRDTLFLILDVALIDYMVKSSNVITLVQAMRLYVLYILVIIVDQYLVLYTTKDFDQMQLPGSRNVSHMVYPHLKRRDIEEIEEPEPKKDTKMTIYGAALVMLSKLNFLNLLFASTERNHSTAENELDSMPQSQDEAEATPEAPSALGVLEQFLKSINPLNLEQWKANNYLWRLLQLISVPVYLCLRLLVPIVDDELEEHGWSKLLNCIQIVELPSFLYLVIMGSHSYHGIPIFLWIALSTAPFAVFVFNTNTTGEAPAYFQYMSILGTLGSIYCIYAVASEVMSILDAIGIITYRSNSFLGCTLLAWGNCVGDLIANVALARQGFQRMGFAACFGAPLFHSLILLGGVYFYRCLQNPEHYYSAGEGTLGENSTVFLLIGLLCTFFAVITTNFVLRRCIGIFMISLYVLYLVYAVLSESEVIHPYGSDHRLDMKVEPIEE